ncbi:SubName: Full=Related to RTM1 protein {ECO:0000313/EMBL:CCA67907.1} [Serendipita indica DSM 11827]|nr:SubName: Full=Related to RTM1 protein {ECO:0000313/EMBL:CCA67907.1} [Serendipita indica DSM 11827]
MSFWCFINCSSLSIYPCEVYYMWPLILATALEFVGYVLRKYTIDHRTEKNPAVIGQVFIIMAPACFAANLYMLVGRIMVSIGSTYSIVRPRWITPIFVGMDILAIGLQGLGAGILFGNEDDLNKLKRARSILTLGLIVQLVAFAIFLFFAIWFDLKATKALRDRMRRVRPLMIAFYVTGALILLRSVYRAVEFLTVDFSHYPVKGYLFTVEWAYYVLDALPIALATMTYNVIFPANYLPNGKSTEVSSGDNLPMSTANKEEQPVHHA